MDEYINDGALIPDPYGDVEPISFEEEVKDDNIVVTPITIMNALFTNKDYILSLTDEAIKSNYFLVNRRLAIQYPLHAQLFNFQKLNYRDVIRFWSDFLYNGTKPPYWVYTSGKKKSENAKKKTTGLSNKEIKEFSYYYDYDIKSVEIALKYYPKEMTEEIKNYLNTVKNA